MSKGKTYATRIDLSAKVRDQVGAILNQSLADLTDLYSQTKYAHWNVRGPEFYQLHELFDKLADTVEEHIDTVAERVTALGGTALGTTRMAAAASKVKEYPINATVGLQTVEALAERYASVAKSTRAAIDDSDDLGDADTADLFTAVSRDIDKSLWFLEAHLQK